MGLFRKNKTYYLEQVNLDASFRQAKRLLDSGKMTPNEYKAHLIYLLKEFKEIELKEAEQQESKNQAIILRAYLD